MSLDWCIAFFRLAASSFNGSTVLEAVEASKLYFDFYVEVVMASLPGQTKEAFCKYVAGQSKLPPRVLELMHDCLGSLELRGALLSDCAFLHFGTLQEFPAASLDAKRCGLQPFYGRTVADARAGPGLVMVNCQASSVKIRRATDDPSPDVLWVEMCSDVDLVVSSGFHLLVGLQGVHVDKPLPAGLCLDGRQLEDSSERTYVVAVYSASDTFKRTSTPEEVVFCGAQLQSWLAERELQPSDLWDASEAGCDLWTARLFAPGAALPGYWDASSFSRSDFLASRRYSLEDLNRLDSALRRDLQRSRRSADG
ncbi:unnamed protein product [Effrenium voratum]|uniref:GDP-fucose pyrophosphorylase domain-containing protein n=1 Tax=Effrenium voratum TaxID=2562239 RepID=A0AA36I170_9DINO|nr:unnamed protein product [Effrenium voratum]CAJ1378846.1 unnamed protein product [Effrenium voratum]